MRGVLNVPSNISSAPGEHPSLPIILFILLVVKSVPSAWDRWWIFLLIISFSISCGLDSVFQWIDLSLVMLFQSFTFVEISIVNSVGLLMGLK